MARSGEYAGVTAIKKALVAEGYDAQQQVVGSSLIKSLLNACREAQGIAAPVPPPPRRRLSAAERSDAARRGAAKRLARNPVEG